MLDLRRATIVVDADEPPYVHRADDDLGAYLARIAGDVGPTAAAGNTTIAIGRRAAVRLAPTLGPALAGAIDGLTAQSYALAAGRLADGGRVLLVAGGDDQGTKFGVLELVARTIDPATGSVPEDLRVRAAPTFRRRGIYLHLGWVYHRP